MKDIEQLICEHLVSEEKETSLGFVAYLKENKLTLYRDTGACWKDKIYYWIKKANNCIGFIAIADPEEPHNRWTVWSDDSVAYETPLVAEEIKHVAWEHIDDCGHCGSCGGGTTKTIFGKRFDNVCGCTFRIDNAGLRDLPFLKTMIQLRIQENV